MRGSEGLYSAEILKVFDRKSGVSLAAAAMRDDGERWPTKSRRGPSAQTKIKGVGRQMPG
jgi:hypothetical protein